MNRKRENSFPIEQTPPLAVRLALGGRLDLAPPTLA